tara:strand:+ start:54 stop:335 length:282 start_codon:yes stop_codon:yes gene_type:complete
MPLYPVVNLKTRETKDLHMSVDKYEVWRKENPDWDKDWSEGCAGLRSLSKEHYSSDAIANPGSYEDKNDSRSDGFNSTSGPNNSLVTDHFGMK